MFKVPEKKGFSLLVIIMIILGLGLAGLGAAKLLGRVGEINRQRQTSVNLNDIQTAVREYYRNHADQGLPGTPGTAGPVPVADLGLENRYIHDTWGTGIEYYRGRTTVVAGLPSITEVTVDGVDAAGYILSFGPDQTRNSTFNAGGAGSRSTMVMGGDDILLPLSVKAEAIKIADQELRVLSSKSCALHIATNSWFSDWASFLAQYGLADTYRYDPWDRDYVWDTDHWVSDGPDWTALTVDDLKGPYLTDALCGFASGGGGDEPVDPFDDLGFWIYPPSGYGNHTITVYSGDNALDVIAIDPIPGGSCQLSLLLFNWAAAAAAGHDTNLSAAWENGGYLLNYDAQVKVAAGDPSGPYAAGIAFRVQPGSTYYSYGLSFVRTDNLNDNVTKIPDELTPDKDKTYIVLWQRTGGCGDVDRMAYAELPTGTEESFFDNMDSSGGWTTANNPDNASNLWQRVLLSGDWVWQINTSFHWDLYERNLISPAFDLPSGGPITLTFDNRRTGSNWDWSGSQRCRARVYIRIDGNWELLETYMSTTNGSVETIDLNDYAGESNVSLRFRLEYEECPSPGNTWRIDDVKVEGISGFPINMTTLMVRVEEREDPETLNFDHGSIEPAVGSTIYQRRWRSSTGYQTTVSATVTGVTVTSGSWAGGNAVGTITVKDKITYYGNWRSSDGSSGGYQYYDDLFISGTKVAELSSFTAGSGRYNLIKAYYGLPYETPAGHTGDTSAFNQNRLANPRGQAHWPPDEGETYTADKDFFTTVQWQAYDSGICQRLGTNNEIIKSSTFTTPTSGTFTLPEVGLQTWGQNGPGSGDNVYFDDWSMQTH